MGSLPLTALIEYLMGLYLSESESSVEADMSDQRQAESLIESTLAILKLWPSHKKPEPKERLDKYIRHLLLRSELGLTTLKLAVHYLIILKGNLPVQPKDCPYKTLLNRRRVFLAAFMLSSKYLHDTTYPARAWSEISNISIEDINATEVEFLMAIDWRLHVSQNAVKSWQNISIPATDGVRKRSIQYAFAQVLSKPNIKRVCIGHVGKLAE